MATHRSSRRAIAVSIVVGLFPALVLAGTSPAQAAVTRPSASGVVLRSGNDQFTMGAREAGTGKALCLDADANASAGAHVNTVYCNSSAYQRWQIGTVGADTIWINVGHPGYALAASSLAAGAAMVLKKVNGSDRTQSFRYYADPSNNFEIFAQYSSPSLVLDGVYRSGSAKNGRQVQLAPDSGAYSNQRWNDQHFS